MIALTLVYLLGACVGWKMSRDFCIAHGHAACDVECRIMAIVVAALWPVGIPVVLIGR